MAIYDLIQRSKKGDQKAREQLVQDNTGLIYAVIKRFYDRGIEQEDLFQIAAVGFLKAIDNFNPELGLKLSTYAVPTMMGEIRRYLRDNGPIKVSRSLKALAAKAAQVRESLLLETGVEPSVSSIAEFLSVEPSELSAALAASKAPDSLDEPRGENGLLLKEIIPAPCREETIVNNLTLCQLIKSLPDREKKILDGLRKKMA